MLGRLFASLLLLFSALCLTAADLSANKKPPAAPVNLNTAKSEELQQVPGIGPVTAEKILQMRKAYGAFKSVDDLLAIKGIGHKRLEKMRKYLTVGRSAPAGKIAAPSKSSVPPKREAPSANPLALAPRGSFISV